MWEIFKLFPSCHNHINGSSLSVLIQSHYYRLFLYPSKASVGMYSRYDYLVCVLFDLAIPTSFFNFIQLFLSLYMMLKAAVTTL